MDEEGHVRQIEHITLRHWQKALASTDTGLHVDHAQSTNSLDKRPAILIAITELADRTVGLTRGLCVKPYRQESHELDRLLNKLSPQHAPTPIGGRGEVLAQREQVGNGTLLCV